MQRGPQHPGTTTAQGRGAGAMVQQREGLCAPSQARAGWSGAWKGSRSSHSLLWETREVTELAASGPPTVGPLWPDSRAERQIPLPGAGERALLDLVRLQSQQVQGGVSLSEPRNNRALGEQRCRAPGTRLEQPPDREAWGRAGPSLS